MTGPGRAAPGRPGAARPYWLGLAVITLGAVWLAGALALPQVATYAVIGPGVFVTLVGGGLVALGALLLVAIARGEPFLPQDAEDADPERPTDWPAFGLTTLAAALPIALLRPLGFPLAAALTFALVARAFGSRRLAKDLAVGLALGVACWLLFSRLLGLPLPGPLPRLPR